MLGGRPSKVAKNSRGLFKQERVQDYFSRSFFEEIVGGDLRLGFVSVGLHLDTCFGRLSMVLVCFTLVKCFRQLACISRSIVDARAKR